MSIDLGVTKMSRTYHPKFRIKSLHVMLDVVSCRPEARTVEDRSAVMGGVNGHPQGDVLGPQTFCLVCLVEGVIFPPALLSQSVDWFSF